MAMRVRTGIRIRRMMVTTKMIKTRMMKVTRGSLRLMR